MRRKDWALEPTEEKNMAEQENIKVARDFIAAYDTKSWDKHTTLTTPDIVYDEKASRRRTEGVGQMVEAFQGWAKAFPDSKGKVTSCFGSGDLVALEVTWTGKHTGPLTTPTGTIAPSSKSFSLPAAYVMTFKAGKIKEARQYFDMADLLRQVGATPK